MQAAELAQAADELYALPPGEFRAARDERAAQAKSAGDRELAAAIGKLRRPTVSAWLVNQLVRGAGDQIGELLDLGAGLREAQSELAGDRLRELSARRRELVSALTRAGRQLAGQAGQQVSEQTERELGGTLEAAVADPAAAEAVRSGRLASALSYTGLGGIDLAEAVAVPQALSGQGHRPAGRVQAGGGRRGRGTGTATAGPGQAQAAGAGRKARTGGAERRGRAGAAGRAGAGGQEARAAEEARRELAEAEAAAGDAEAALAQAQQQAAATAGEHEAARQRIADLERELDEARAAGARAARAAREAQRGRDAAARALTAAQRRLARARQRAGSSSPHHRASGG